MNRSAKIVLSLCGTWLVASAVLGYVSYRGELGDPHPWGVIETTSVPANEISAREERYRPKLESSDEKQILFGDLHVHTTLSVDAYQMSMPYMQGEGLYPVSDACDFARYCSSVDFWSINDHAEGITPDFWTQTKQAIRQCNAVTDPESPDVVAFLGYEWSQAGVSPDKHYGHKNVIFLEEEEGKVPSHPVGAVNEDLGPRGFSSPWYLRALSGMNIFSDDYQRLQDYNRFVYDLEQVEICDSTVPYSELPDDCMVLTKTPSGLFSMLEQWGGESIVIPHGNTWGLYTPASSSWDKQLLGDQHDEERQILMEVFSGHGNSEEYRDFSAVKFDDKGKAYCPESQANYQPGCQRAGEIIKERCLAKGNKDASCDVKAEQAKQFFVESGTMNFMTVPGTKEVDWLDSEQCTDCYLPTFRYRPGGSAQYALAVRNFDQEGAPKRFKFGLIGSSDNHKAKAGPGYKEYARTVNTESGPGLRDFERKLIAAEEAPVDEARPFSVITKNARDVDPKVLVAGSLMLFERQSSFFYTGGLMAAHSVGRKKGDIWDAMQKREVYATSGSRTLLWFDLVDGEQTIPMGASTERNTKPHFKVKAVGDFKQNPGCPDYSVNQLTANKIENLCKGECYNPSNERNIIEKIDVIRIQPQNYKAEPMSALIKDDWLSFDCPPDQNGCEIEFSDDQFENDGRDTVYYVRVTEAKINMINGKQQDIKRDENGELMSMNSCDRNKAKQDDCLAMEHPRAWSSPIFVDYKK